ncbi:hypothetical protein JKF63_05014 [Porcisia hertigi]|uniref:Ubiquitin carboxyl-terminal hydrolase n=1 Tax=Porcisia hertigi TaxID=2761500 RepID=A0A836I5T9_9TRYP|nr:hypothetical protein JKF63_05014 [Porcisia hertigi]
MGNEASKPGATTLSTAKARRSQRPGATAAIEKPPPAQATSVASPGAPASPTAPATPSRTAYDCRRRIALPTETLPAKSSSGTKDTVGSSVPLYVNAKSMVYTLPSFTPKGSLSGAASNGAGLRIQTMAIPATTSQLQLLLSPSTDLRMGPLASPTSPCRRHVPNVNASPPIPVPTYNTNTATAVEDLSCSSPVLKSYWQHSFSQSKKDACLANSPTSPSTHLPVISPFSPGIAEAALPIHPSNSLSRGAGSGTPSMAIHTQFLEITGHPLGLENYGNTCYCNSVIQLIYHCTPLRLRLLELHQVYLTKKGRVGFEEDTVLFELCSLIAVMHKSNNRAKEKYPRKKIATRDLLNRVRAKKNIFNNDMQHDAHEFTMFLLNEIWDTEQRIMADPANANLFVQHEASMEKKSDKPFFWKHKGKLISNHSKKSAKLNQTSSAADAETAAAVNGNGNGDAKGDKVAAGTQQLFTKELTPLQVILQGQFGSLTACLECENVSARSEVFADLSLETSQGTSLLHCLDHFGDPEYFWGKNKLRCDVCKMPVRAAKTIHVQQLPQYALLIHLKRFQYDVKSQTFTKKSDHVALPMQMDVEEHLTDPEVIQQSLCNQQANSEKNDDGDASGTGNGNSNSSGTTEEVKETSSPDTFKPASKDVRRKLRGIARHKARFELTGFVAHIGDGPDSGHYFTCVRYSPHMWRRFDDETVSTMTERDIQQYFGVPFDAVGVVTSTAYILLYERVA